MFAHDEIFVTLFLRAAAQLTIESGDKLQTLIDKIGEHEISAMETRSRFNYFAGSAQAASP